jgi:RNA polymerase sigma-70 factor, ECF subfamily
MDTRAAADQETERTDAALAQSVSSGDGRAFEVLMRRYNRRLYRLARAALHDDVEAKDALQDAYLNAYRSIGQFRGDASLSTWLSRLVLNECAARRRRSARRDNIVPMVSLDSNPPMAANIADSGSPPENAVTRMQVREILERKVGELPDILRIVFVMRSVDELSVQDTAEVLGVTEEAVRSRHFRAKALLRESLAKEVDVAERDIYEFGGDHCDAVVATVLARIAQIERQTP